MNFYLDFDYTIFDTYSFRNELYKILKANGFDRSYLKLTMEEGRQKLINIREIFKELSKKYEIPLNNFIVPLDNLYSRCENFVFSDVEDFLKYLKNNNHRIYILTWGNKEYQREKLKASKIEKYIDGAIFTEKLKYNLELDYKNSIFIDDSIRDLKGLYNKDAKQVFRIKRENGKNSDKELNIDEIKEFNSLYEIKEYLIKMIVN